MADVPLDADGRINAHAKCVGCDYNLRGLDRGAVCPECGVAVEDSIQGDFLQFADAAWVKGLASSMTWAFTTLGLTLIFALAFNDLRFGSFSEQLGSVVVFILLMSAPLVCALVACLKFSAPEPNARTPNPSPDWRATARLFAKLFVALLFITGLCAFEFPRWYLNYKTTDGIFFGLSWFAMVISLVGYFSAGRYATTLALRIPDKHLASHSRFVTVGGALVNLSLLAGLSMVLLEPAVGNVFSFFSPSPLPAFLETIIILGALATLLGGVVFGLGVLVLMFRFWFVLRDAAKAADILATAQLNHERRERYADIHGRIEGTPGEQVSS